MKKTSHEKFGNVEAALRGSRAAGHKTMAQLKAEKTKEMQKRPAEKSLTKPP